MRYLGLVLLAIMMLATIIPGIALAVNSVSVSPNPARPGDTVTISVNAQYSWEKYSVIVVTPDGQQITIASNKQGDQSIQWTIPSYFPSGEYTIKVDSQYYSDKQVTLVVEEPTTTTSSDNPFADVHPDAPEPVKNFFSKLLSLAMFIGWGVTIAAFIFAAVMNFAGKEAPQWLGKVIVSAFILSCGITVLWWLMS